MAADDGLDWFHHPEEFSKEKYIRLLKEEVRRLRDENAKLKHEIGDFRLVWD